MPSSSSSLNALVVVKDSPMFFADVFPASTFSLIEFLLKSVDGRSEEGDMLILRRDINLDSLTKKKRSYLLSNSVKELERDFFALINNPRLLGIKNCK